MEEKCTLSKKVGGVCGLDKRYKETNVVPLLSCKRNVTEHTRVVGITGDIDTESELILARASIFVSPSDISTWQICPAHRSRLGIGWRRGANRCRVPAVMSSHGERKRIADRGIRKSESKKILRYSGVFLPVGSGMYIAHFIWRNYCVLKLLSPSKTRSESSRLRLGCPVCWFTVRERIDES